MCRDEFLHYLRVREWQDLVGQLRTIARGLDIVEADSEAEPAAPAQIHAALLAGLLSHIGPARGATTVIKPTLHLIFALRANTPEHATRASSSPPGPS